MFEWIRTRLLRWLRVPPTPEPPMGAPGSVRVFRAGANFYKLRLFGWTLAQASTMAGIIFSFWFLGQVQQAVVARQAPANAAPAATPPASPSSASAPLAPSATPVTPAPAPAVEPGSEKKPATKARSKSRTATRSAIARLADRTPLWFFYVIVLLETVGLAFYFVQLLATYAALRLDFEQRWYIVTDRSLRIRHGLWQVEELTMSFANLQQVSVSQGPLQRLLGVSDVRVQTAGGGGEGRAGQQAGSLHTAEFHSVDNASEIRDLILDRLRHFRAAGLGDPEDQRHDFVSTPTASFATSAVTAEALAAAQSLLVEARALRRALAT